MTGWSEYHVHLHRRAATDGFIREVLPAILGAARPHWWFIRYWHGGPHLRVRVPEGRDADAILAALRAAAAARAGGPALDRDLFYATCTFDGAAVDSAALPWFADGTVRRVAYQPETDFYGTGADLARNEAMFGASSQLAVRLIAAAGDDLRLLGPVAADLLGATIRHAGSARATAFIHAYRLFLAPFGAAPDGRLALATTPGAPGNAWATALADFEAAGVQPVRRLILQHHLLINRIGLSPRQEAEVFAALHREVVDG